MNTGWMARYLVVVDNVMISNVAYIVPLTGAQMSREMKRISDKFGADYKLVQLVRDI